MSTQRTPSESTGGPPSRPTGTPSSGATRGAPSTPAPRITGRGSYDAGSLHRGPHDGSSYDDVSRNRRPHEGGSSDTGPVDSRSLGRALRQWRDRADPADSGLPAGRRRRAAGLRREELAGLAGMSVDYVVRLEQGRAPSPSAQILGALARALRLSEEERRHLFLLAGRTPPTDGLMAAEPPPGVRRLLAGMAGEPVGVYDAAWTLLDWNPLFAALMGDPSGQSARERNVLWRHFTGGPTRVAHDPAQTARFDAAAVADLRAATARYPADPVLRALVADLLAAGGRFAALWEEHAVGTQVADTKTVHHPEVGPVALHCDVLEVPGTGLRVVVHTPAPGTDAAEKLRLLAVIGTQPLSPRAAPPPTAAL